MLEAKAQHIKRKTNETMGLNHEQEKRAERSHTNRQARENDASENKDKMLLDWLV